MLKVLGVILTVYACTNQLDALLPKLCQQTPKEKHCLIEHAVKDRWPHTIRYVYNWYTKNCFEIRWAEHCPRVPHPVLYNNFPTELECLDQCAGWA